MNFSKLSLVVELIKQEQTGTPEELAKKIALSERMVYKYINCIKNDFKAPVIFSKKKKSYCFKEKGELNLSWVSSSKKQ